MCNFPAVFCIGVPFICNRPSPTVHRVAAEPLDRSRHPGNAARPWTLPSGPPIFSKNAQRWRSGRAVGLDLREAEPGKLRSGAQACVQAPEPASRLTQAGARPSAAMRKARSLDSTVRSLSSAPGACFHGPRGCVQLHAAVFKRREPCVQARKAVFKLPIPAFKSGEAERRVRKPVPRAGALGPRSA
jgi:hypothetical protein